MVCSLALFFLAASATDVRSASRTMATTCSSVNQLFVMGSSLRKSHLSRNHWYEETGQVRTPHSACTGAAPSGNEAACASGDRSDQSNADRSEPCATLVGRIAERSTGRQKQAGIEA